MKNINQLQEEIKTLQIQYGLKYFIFIAPFSLKDCKNLRIFENFVSKRLPIPLNLLNGISKLDIYFVDLNNISSIKNGKPLAFKRFSSTDLSKL